MTGNFSKKAAEEAAKFGTARIAASSKDKNFTYIPDVKAIAYDPNASYIHICQNNTIFGTTYKDVPQVDGIPAGMAIAIIRDDLLGKSAKGIPAEKIPTMMNYTPLLDKDSMYNTPPCWCIYMTGLVMDYLQNEVGGLEEMAKINHAKAKVLYDYLDGQDFYNNPVQPEYRSMMNVTFTSPNPDMDKKFCAAATEAGFVNLKGHRLVGGMRASIYNAMPAQGVNDLVDFMEKFRKENA